jgi:xanthine/uracil/vitamin C permease (AzgA family)
MRTWRRALEEFKETPSFENLLEILFKIERRGSNVNTEIICGFIHFLSTAAVLAVNPAQLEEAGYDRSKIACGTAVACAVTNALIGLIGNVPFVATPTLATSIYFSVFMKSNQLSVSEGNMIILVFGIILVLCTFRYVNNIIKYLMPKSMQIGFDASHYLTRICLLTHLMTFEIAYVWDFHC